MEIQPQVHDSRFENEEYVEQFYQQSDDPWDNKGKYIKAFEGITDCIDFGIWTNVNLIDIGCGGGNVLEALISQIESINLFKIRVRGIDTSKTAISKLIESHKFDSYNPKFINGSITDIQCISTIEKNLVDYNALNIVSIVDVLYYIRSKSRWMKALINIFDQIPVGSYLIIADSAFSKVYRDYLEKEIPHRVTIKKGVSLEPIVPKSESQRAKYLRWTVYKKVYF